MGIYRKFSVLFESTSIKIVDPFCNTVSNVFQVAMPDHGGQCDIHPALDS